MITKKLLEKHHGLSTVGFPEQRVLARRDSRKAVFRKIERNLNTIADLLGNFHEEHHNELERIKGMSHREVRAALLGESQRVLRNVVATVHDSVKAVRDGLKEVDA